MIDIDIEESPEHKAKMVKVRWLFAVLLVIDIALLVAHLQ